MGLVIFDADDTLWETQVLYETAKQRFLYLLAESSIDATDALDVLYRIDSQQVATHGYSRARFPSSLVKTYKYLCSRQQRPPDQRIITEILKIGETVFVTPPSLYPDTKSCLSILGRFYMLALVTKGDYEIQQLRLSQTRISDYFTRIYIVPEKSARDYARVLEDFEAQPNDAWVVGNSVRSDINPGLQLGLRCILVKRATWQYEEADLLPGDVRVVETLSDVVREITAADLNLKTAPTPM